MTFREKWLLEHPGKPFDPTCRCPSMCGYEPVGSNCANPEKISDMPRVCSDCWDREMRSKENPHILDSGERTEFATGAVRDIQKGKGRCDLMPLRIAAKIMDGDSIIDDIGLFQDTGDTAHLYFALRTAARMFNGLADMLLEVSKHYEDGAEKYGEYNWQKGLPVNCYINSAIRHYLKWLRGDTDERHDRAFVWNLMCCIWEVDYSPRAKGENAIDETGEMAENMLLPVTKAPEQVRLGDCIAGLFEFEGRAYLKVNVLTGINTYIDVITGIACRQFHPDILVTPLEIREVDYSPRAKEGAE